MNDLTIEVLEVRHEAEDLLDELPPHSLERETVARSVADLRRLQQRVGGLREATRETAESAGRTLRAVRSTLERLRWQRGDFEPQTAGAGLEGESHTHVVCDALAEVRARFVREPERPLESIANEVFDQHVQRFSTLREYRELQAAGAELLEEEGLAGGLVARYRRDPAGTRALLGFVSFVRRSCGNGADGPFVGGSARPTGPPTNRLARPAADLSG